MWPLHILLNSADSFAGVCQRGAGGDCWLERAHSTLGHGEVKAGEGRPDVRRERIRLSVRTSLGLGILLAPTECPCSACERLRAGVVPTAGALVIFVHLNEWPV